MALVAAPFGVAVPLSVAPVVPTPLGAVVVTLGAVAGAGVGEGTGLAVAPKYTNPTNL